MTNLYIRTNEINNIRRESFFMITRNEKYWKRIRFRWIWNPCSVQHHEGIRKMTKLMHCGAPGFENVTSCLSTSDREIYATYQCAVASGIGATNS